MQELRAEGYWPEGVYDSRVYDDIEVKDFNAIFVNEDIVSAQYG